MNNKMKKGNYNKDGNNMSATAEGWVSIDDALPPSKKVYNHTLADFPCLDCALEEFQKIWMCGM